MGFKGGGKTAEVLDLLIWRLDASHPGFQKAICSMHTKQPGHICRLRPPLVLLVHGCGDIAQIRQFVVGAIAVNVVDFMSRPFASHDQPSQSMGGDLGVAHTDFYVAIRGHRTN